MNSDPKSKRWSIRASLSDDQIVRRMAAHNRMSLNEYVVRNAVAAAFADLADHRLFMLSAKEWQELQKFLDRPVRPNPRLEELLTQSSVLEIEGN